MAPLSNAGVPASLAPAERSAVGLLRRPAGEQGAHRSAFLLKIGLSKEAFVATGIVSAVIVDAARLIVYGAGFMAGHLAQSQDLLGPVGVGMVCAFIGSLAGKHAAKGHVAHCASRGGCGHVAGRRWTSGRSGLAPAQQVVLWVLMLRGKVEK